MKGLEGIKNKILDTAKTEAAKILESGNEQAEKIIFEAEKIASEYLLNAKNNDLSYYNAVITREESLAESESRKTLLKAKQELIEEIISQALNSISELPSSEKKQIYVKALTNRVKDGDKVRFNKKDSQIGKEILDEIKIDFSIDEEFGEFIGGFIIIRGLIEINMTFEMIVNQNKSVLITKAAQELFVD